MFAVMGITGNVGGAVADTLLQHGKQVRGIVRDAEKAQAWEQKGVEIVTSNYDDHLITAFSGVEGVFVMIPPNLVPEPGFPDSVVRIAAIKKALLAAKPPRASALARIDPGLLAKNEPRVCFRHRSRPCSSRLQEGHLAGFGARQAVREGTFGRC